MLKRLELPRIRELTKEQERARALPLQGQHLIVGGPGTGKSVVALLRAQRLASERSDYRFLVFNHLLHRASRALYGEGLKSDTWMSWFFKEYQRLTGQKAPLLPTENPTDFQPIDWPTTLADVRDINWDDGQPPAMPALVIDEGQDMPPQFYECLATLGFENFYVVADQNQQITDQNSSRQDLQDALVLDSDQVIELRRNFRNSHAIARLAAVFRPDDPASPAPDLPSAGKGAGAASLPVLLEYRREQMREVAHRILIRWMNQPRCLIGVITPNNRIRSRYFEELGESSGAHMVQGRRARIETFFGTHRPDIEMDRVDILVINVQACKGLEFDVVVCADIDAHQVVTSNDRDILRKQLYVMLSRSRKQVVLLKRDGKSGPIDGLLPQDPSILQRSHL